MSPEQFLEGFDPKRWLTAEEIVSRLDATGYWKAMWPAWAYREKVEYVVNVCETWDNEHGECLIASKMVEVGPERWVQTYKPTAHVIPEEFRELYLALRDELGSTPCVPKKPQRRDALQSADDDDLPF